MRTLKNNPIGKSFGKLTVLCKSETRLQNKISFDCVCECGNFQTVTNSNLWTGRVNSCGCLRKSLLSDYSKSRHVGNRLLRGAPACSKLAEIHFRKEREKKLGRRDMGICKELVADVMRRDDYECKLCNSKSSHKNKLQIHHIKPWKSNPDLRYDTNNLIVLCFDCHLNKAHSGSFRYGLDMGIQSKLLNINNL